MNSDKQANQWDGGIGDGISLFILNYPTQQTRGMV